MQQVQWRSGLRRTLHAGDYHSVHVPIYVSLMLMVSYIALGAMLFTLVEDWDYFISSYFCFITLSITTTGKVKRTRSFFQTGSRVRGHNGFITLSTIGFGDYVPGMTSLRDDSQGKMVLCALYLLVGLALLAMCFDLMQEEVRRKFRALGTKIGLFERQ